LRVVIRLGGGVEGHERFWLCFWSFRLGRFAFRRVKFGLRRCGRRWAHCFVYDKKGAFPNWLHLRLFNGFLDGSRELHVEFSPRNFALSFTPPNGPAFAARLRAREDPTFAKIKDVTQIILFDGLRFSVEENAGPVLDFELLSLGIDPFPFEACNFCSRLLHLRVCDDRGHAGRSGDGSFRFGFWFRRGFRKSSCPSDGPPSFALPFHLRRRKRHTKESE